MNRFINTVTVTGADDSVNPGDLISLQQEYPFAEFGILLSRKAMDHTRFPSYKWLKDLAHRYQGLKLAGHFCGSWVKEMYATGTLPDDLINEYSDILMIPFQRYQFNTHGYKHPSSQENVDSLLRGFEGAKLIFQYDEVNKHLLEFAKASNRGNISALFDLSHGAGVLPETWPKPLDGVYCGYAGGLSPDNVAENLAKIEPLVGNRRIWIDAETHLYSNNGQQFDLEKVRNFLHNASKYVL